jgi:alkanesulfonate monooxygenase SsuD/methylene tetrahydromethanopterin reductase-like flavin-dependent oxidoreductase (luciferase family)
VTLVPGLDQPGERQALGTSGRRRGDMIEDLVPELRSWWAGEGVDVGDGVVARLAVRPLQDPLEVWLGGSGPGAIRRAGRVADGWLGARVSPQRAGVIRQAILDEATSAGRVIDAEHFGLSIAYARVDSDLDRARRMSPLPVRRSHASPGAQGDSNGTASMNPASANPGSALPERDLARAEVVPVGAPALRDLVGRLVAEGLSKFVVRPAASPEPFSGGAVWSDELEWLAATLLDLQS